ncbi:MAG: hypothetical protein SVM79_07725 [Chloroflexota bacterium]|nr:hypothetical protein [Chloroflexota bacterium]
MSTVSSLMPLILDTISKEQVERLVNQHLRNPGEFWARYPVPVNPLLADEETIKGHVVWRGKETWFFTNWYIAGGLRKQGRRFPEHRNEYAEIAEELMRRSYKLVRKEGFREYYDARTGKGGGAFDFGWSTLLLDMVYDVKA